jgi:hypothetical protein
MSAKAFVNLTIKDAAIVDYSNITHDIALLPAGPGNVTQPGKNTFFHVRGGSATFHITITSQAGESWRPISMTVAQQTAPAAAIQLNTPTGPAGCSFNVPQLTANSVEFTETYTPAAPAAASKSRAYKFSIIVQRASDGRVGIIDPGVENEDEV